MDRSDRKTAGDAKYTRNVRCCMAFDPAVFVDDDGTGYLYAGGGVPGGSNPTQGQWADPKTARVMKLGPDMTSVAGSASTIDAPFMFEDSGMHKYNGKYYYSYCINFGGAHPADKPPGEIGYMTNSSPMNSFSYRGHFLKNPGAFFGGGGNNHHAVFNFKTSGMWCIILKLSAPLFTGPAKDTVLPI